MISTYKLDLHWVKLTHYAEYLGQWSFSWKVIARTRIAHTQRTGRFTRTTKVIGYNSDCDFSHPLAFSSAVSSAHLSR